MRPGLLTLAVLPLLAVGGCGEDDPGPVAGVELRDATAADLDRAVQERGGKVVLVDFWATWCQPCRERFPHLVELHDRYRKDGLACISVSLDEPDNREAALKFLRRRRATMTNLFWTDRTPAGGRTLETTYRYGGGIPHMVLFGRDGRVAWTSADELPTPEELDRMVRDELAKK
ncbi:MAG: redoxin family protein [Gemmataceae bacterium]|nr:redoxin family protein [Gemmataceae bacterium]